VRNSIRIPGFPKCAGIRTSAGTPISAGTRTGAGIPTCVWTLISIGMLALSGCAAVGLPGGESVTCGDTSRVGFYFARFKGPRAGKGEVKSIWSGSREVVLDGSTGVEGAAITDLRIVGVGGGSSVNVGGNVVLGGQQVEGGSGSDASDTGAWRLDVILSGDGSSRLSAAKAEIEGSYRILALVVGDEVFSASVDLPIRFGVAQIELPTSRSKNDGRRFFEQKLGCSAQP